MLEVGHAVGAPLMATALHRQLLLPGVAAGWSERDNSSIMAVLRSLIEPPGAPPETAAPASRRGNAEKPTPCRSSRPTEPWAASSTP